MKRTYPGLRLMLIPLLSLGLLFILGGTASAHSSHAKVLTAIPAIGSTIAKIPSSVVVDCAENINPDPAKSNLFIFGPSGGLISQGNAKVSISNPKEMSVSMKADGNGVYIVRWITVSALDGDPDEGAFVFTVNPKASVTPTAVTTTNTTTTNTTAGSSGIPLWVPIVVGVLALLVGLGGGFGLGRQAAASASSVGAMRKSISAQREEEDTTSKRP